MPCCSHDGAPAYRYVAGPGPPNTGSTISIVPMHRRGVVCNGIDDLWGLLRWRRIGMRLSEVCAQGRRSPTGAHTLGRVPRGSVTVRMYMSTPLWMREGTSLSPPPFTGTFLLRGPLAHVAYIVLVRGHLYLTTLRYELLEHTWVLSPDYRQRDRAAIAYLSLLGLTAVRGLVCAEARRRCSGC